MPFLYAMTFSLAFPYTRHKATPNLVWFFFRFVKITVFLLLSSLLRFIINRSRTTFINALSHILFWYIMFTLPLKMLNQFLYFIQFSAISIIFWKIKDRVEHQYDNLPKVSNKNCSKKKLVVFWDQFLAFQKVVILLLIVSPFLIVYQNVLKVLHD